MFRELLFFTLTRYGLITKSGSTSPSQTFHTRNKNIKNRTSFALIWLNIVAAKTTKGGYESVPLSSYTGRQEYYLVGIFEDGSYREKPSLIYLDSDEHKKN